MKPWKILLSVPTALGLVSAAAATATAASTAIQTLPTHPAVTGSTAHAHTVDSLENASKTTAPLQFAQVTNVSELSDVQPGDWAFTALQRLVEEYGCLEGYPDRTYRGNRALTRYEFAAGLNACLDVVIQLINGPNLDEVRRLQEEFAAELATVRGRVDTLETDVAELQANQFSTTTQLRGQLDAHLVVPFDSATEFDANIGSGGPAAAAVAGEGDGGGEEADATFEYRARLNFDTSFTGEDRLRIRLQASDDAGALANTESGLADQSGRNGTEDNVGVDDVYYSFPIGNRFSGIIAANSIATDDFVTSTIVPFDGPSVTGAGTPEFYGLYAGGESLGAGVNFAFSENIVLDLGYATDTGNDNRATFVDGDGVTRDGGIFGNGSYIAQLNFLTDGLLNAAVTYIGALDAVDGENNNSIAGLVSLDFGGFQIGGHYAANDIEGEGDADSYMGGIAIADLFGEGNEFGIFGGVSPAVGRNPLLVEAYYQISVNEFFTFTPAIIYADNDSGVGQDDNVYGALRATLSF